MENKIGDFYKVPAERYWQNNKVLILVAVCRMDNLIPVQKWVIVREWCLLVTVLEWTENALPHHKGNLTKI